MNLRLLIYVVFLLVTGSPVVLAQQTGCAGPVAVCAFSEFVLKVQSGQRSASAVYIEPGYAVTNRHIVMDSQTVTLSTRDGRSFDAQVVPSAYLGDLVMLRVEGLMLSRTPSMSLDTASGETVTVLGYAEDQKRSNLYRLGYILLPAVPGAEGRYIQHTALARRGSDGGALVSERGELVGIATTGSDRISEAVPIADIKSMRAALSADHAEVHARLNRSYKRCRETLRQMPKRRARLARRAIRYLSEACVATGNSSYMEEAAQVLGRAGNLREARELFSRALEVDEHALRARIGLVVTLILGGIQAEALPHLKWLRGVLPTDREVMRLSIQAGMHGGDEPFAKQALRDLEHAAPALALPMRRFVDSFSSRQ